MKALQNVYHVDCFKCFECGDKLEKGDEFILKDNKLYCSADFNVADPKFDSKCEFLYVKLLTIGILVPFHKKYCPKAKRVLVGMKKGLRDVNDWIERFDYYTT